jgi:hypothetical protein
MMHLPASVRVYLCLTPCDMRKSAPPSPNGTAYVPSSSRLRRTPA